MVKLLLLTAIEQWALCKRWTPRWLRTQALHACRIRCDGQGHRFDPSTRGRCRQPPVRWIVRGACGHPTPTPTPPHLHPQPLHPYRKQLRLIAVSCINIWFAHTRAQVGDTWMFTVGRHRHSSPPEPGRDNIGSTG